MGPTGGAVAPKEGKKMIDGTACLLKRTLFVCLFLALQLSLSLNVRVREESSEEKNMMGQTAAEFTSTILLFLLSLLYIIISVVIVASPFTRFLGHTHTLDE